MKHLAKIACLGIVAVIVGVAVHYAVKAVLFAVGDFHLNNRQSALHHAVLGGSIPQVARLLDAGMDINIKDERKENVLWSAVYEDNYALADYLIIRGIRVDEKNVIGKTLQEYCVREADVECIAWFEKLPKGSSTPRSRRP